MKTALVTGGSSGLGFEMARQLAAQGYHVAIVARTAASIENAVEAMRREGLRATGFQGDIRDPRDMKRIAESFGKKFDALDFLVLNAGVVHVRLLADYDQIEEMKQDIETNLWGTVLSAHVFAPLLNAGAKILFISSGLGLAGVAGYSTYCAAKAGVINFAEALRRELYHRKISVYVACPGDVDTPQYREECRYMPEWMRAKRRALSSVLPARVVAQRILKKCSGKRFLLITDTGVASLVLVKKLLPARWGAFLLDRLFPMPVGRDIMK